MKWLLGIAAFPLLVYLFFDCVLMPIILGKLMAIKVKSARDRLTK